MRTALCLVRSVDHVNSDSSTRRLVAECVALGMRTSVAVFSSLQCQNGNVVRTAAMRVELGPRGRLRPIESHDRLLPVGHFGRVILRPAPPFDLALVEALRVLATVGTTFINAPDVLLRWTSKTALLDLPDTDVPKSIVTADRMALKDFVQHRACFVKQLHRAEGRGVARVERGDPDRIITKYSNDFRSPVLLQHVVRSSAHTRVWIVNGAPIAAADTRNIDDIRLMDLGALSGTATRVGGHLYRLGVRFAAVDFVGTKAIEANICRPGLIAEYERASGTNLAHRILVRLLQKSWLPER